MKNLAAFIRVLAQLASSALAQSVLPPTPPVRLAVNPVTGKVYTANAAANAVTVLNAATGTSTTVAVGAGPDFIAVNPVTNRIYSACRDGRHRDRDVARGLDVRVASPGCTSSSTTVSCDAGSVAVGSTTQFVVVARPVAPGSVTSTASVSASQADPSTANNNDALAVTVDPAPAAVATLRYRLYNPMSQEHLFTTDQNEYNVLGAGGVWQQEGTVGKVLDDPGSFNGVTAVPYYRLYNTATLWHHWTTDANEYYTLITCPG